MDNQEQNRIQWIISLIGSGILALAVYIQNGGRPDLEKRLGGQWLGILGVVMLVGAAIGAHGVDGFSLVLEDAVFIAAAGLTLIIKNSIDDTKALQARRQVDDGYAKAGDTIELAKG